MSPPRFGSSLSSRPVLCALCWPRWLPLLGALLAALGAGLTALLGAARLLRGLARTRALPLPHVSHRGAVTIATAASIATAAPIAAP